MNLATSFTPSTKQRHHRKRKNPATPPAALTLVAAVYEVYVLELTFDQAIDITSLDGAGIFVNDVDGSGIRWGGTGPATMLSPTTVRIALVELGDASGSGITLTAPDSTGIVAAEGAATWGGVTDLDLPFG